VKEKAIAFVAYMGMRGDKISIMRFCYLSGKGFKQSFIGARDFIGE
jgi:hypothetical protein